MGEARLLKSVMADKGFATVAELISRIGMTEDALYRLIHSRKVRSVKIGKLWFVELASLAVFLGPEASKLLELNPTKPLLPPEE